MNNTKKIYVNGKWSSGNGNEIVPVVNPATEEVITEILLANEIDLNFAVKSAKNAFESYSIITLSQKIDLFNNIIEVFKKRIDDLATVISLEMGSPINLSKKAQAPSGLGHFLSTLSALKKFNFEEAIDEATIITKEPVGVCGLITPWNWPINQIACKVAPALAAGCTLILKPSEIAPLSSIIFTEIMHEAGVPGGVFNLLQGDSKLGVAMSKHSEIDMISFTGSTKAGISVAKNSADTVKRVTQELGGKSANIILRDADFEKSFRKGVIGCMSNSGQSCNAPTRMIIPNEKMEDAINLSKEIIKSIIVGDPNSPETTLGPLANKNQFEKVKYYINLGINEGATLVVGGNNFPKNIKKGYFVLPTIFANVENNMKIAKEEIFGPVLVIIGYENESEVIKLANDSEYGLAGYISSSSIDKAISLAKQIRTGMVHINYAPVNQKAPFGGYKKSGNGREWGKYGIDDFLENKAIVGIKPN
ncbi:MAG: 3-succinoylsemialdehyde-pyridine dehydrogenase [Alphaproteobacteria bacterium MarineAlpha9_Bin4]|nr:aldehyde dehydrogenase family protein [Pelagibacterales bacterium]PPR26549.1 MAG: 3-succinoylsemialdehyde-pyridine dehydrogenase [Alphaproteobacteria bacterium MarineAlpha9_Bin4]